MNRRSIDRAVLRRGAALVLALAGFMAVAGNGSAIAAGELPETGAVSALLLPMLVAALIGLAVGWLVQPAVLIDITHAGHTGTRPQAATSPRSADHGASQDPMNDQLSRLSELSHALRTPLNSVIGFSELMRGEVFGPLGSQKYRDYADHIQDGAQVLLSRVDDIIQVANASHGSRHDGAASQPASHEIQRAA